MTLHHKAAWLDVALLLDLADHEANVGAEMAERELHEHEQAEVRDAGTA